MGASDTTNPDMAMAGQTDLEWSDDGEQDNGIIPALDDGQLEQIAEHVRAIMTLLKLDFEDEIVRDTLITRGGKVVNPRVCELLGIEPPVPADDPVAAGQQQPAASVQQDDPPGENEYKIAEGGED